VTAIDASNGKTILEHTYDSATGGLNLSEGAGPHSTPLIIGDRLFTMGSRLEMFALDKNTGKVLWQHDLVKEIDGVVVPSPQDGVGPQHQHAGLGPGQPAARLGRI
jgi:glucose dehydrogenase